MKAHRLALVAAVVVGALLRIHGLGAQVVKDDEFHGLQATAKLGLVDLAARRTPHGFHVDYSVPLALWNRMLLQTTGLDEWGLRLPVLLGGILLVPVVGLAVGRRAGRFEGAVTAWLLALSPPLILYSRFARPYDLVALLSFLALVSWLRWRREADWRFGVGSSGAGAAAVWLNLVAAPAVVAVWGLGFVTALWRRGHPSSAATARRWAGFVALGLALMLLLLWPSFESLFAFVAKKAQSDRPSLASLWGGAQMLFGTKHSAVLAALLALTGIGGWMLHRSAPLLASGLVLMAISQGVALYVIAPKGFDDPIVLARYLFPALPGLLAFAGVGLARSALMGGPLGRFVPAGLAALGLAVLFGVGPGPALYSGPNAYTSHPFHYAPAHWNVRTDRVPSYYTKLADDSRVTSVVEAPWILEWWRTIYGDYQRIHGKPVTTLSAVSTFAVSGMSLRTVTSLERVAPGFEGFEVIVVHKDIVREWLHVTGVSAPDIFEHWTTPLYASDAATVLEECMESAALRLVHEDDWIAVFERR